MNNQQISELFNDSVHSLDQPVSLDYRDRAVDLAIYFNETIEDAATAEKLVEEIRWAMMTAYAERYKLPLPSKREEDNDPNPSSEEVPRD